MYGSEGFEVGSNTARASHDGTRYHRHRMSGPTPPLDPAPRAPARAARRLPGACAILIALGAGAILSASLGRVVYQENFDEGFYLRYVRIVQEQGLTGFRRLFEEYLAIEEFHVWPNPLRVGFIAVGALWVSGFGVTFAALSKLSVASHVVLVILGFAFTRRRTSDGRALLVAALLASSPLLLALGRRALMDAFATLTAALAIWLYLELLRRPARPGLRAGFVAAFTGAILVKETSILLIPPFAAAWALERFVARSELRAWPFAGLLGLAPALCGLVWLAASGHPVALLRVVEIVLGSPATNAYAIEYGSGPWYRYLVDFVALSPWPTILALGGLASTLARCRPGAWNTERAFFATLAIVLVAEFSLFTKNVRYLAVLELPIAFLAVACLDEILAGLRANTHRILAATAVVLVSWMGWHTFDTLFVEGGLYDPVTADLLGLRHMIPWP